MIAIVRMFSCDKACCPAINNLLKVLSKKGRTINESKFVRITSDDDTYFFAAKDTEKSFPDNLAGMALIFFQWRPEGIYAGIHSVAVSADYQGKGIGSMLDKEMIKTAKEFAGRYKEKFSIELTSNPNNPDRHKAINMYLKHGFRLVAESVDEHGTNLYRLEVTP